MTAIFDDNLRAMRRDRAFRHGPELFLFDRAFEDVEERLALFRRDFGRALLVGCPCPAYADRLRLRGLELDVLDPGAEFARAAGGSRVVEDQWDGPLDHYDLCIAFGTLDTVNDLPGALMRMRLALRPQGALIGVMAGGNSLPVLRAAMRDADQAVGISTPHVHPRIDPANLGLLLSQCGFADPVVDIDRVDVAYSSFDSLVSDLRRMGATNLLAARSRQPIGKAGLRAARKSFANPHGGKRVETFELLNFAAVAGAETRMPGR